MGCSKVKAKIPWYMKGLGSITAWHGFTRPDGVTIWRRTLRGYALTPVYRWLTWARWKAGRAPRCGDLYCYEKAHWPGGKPLYP
jgi:hypothetical protein